MAVLAHNLSRWTLAAAGDDWRRATVATLQTTLVAMPARIVHSARRIARLRAPRDWPWADAFLTAMVTIAALPRAPT